MRTTPPFRADHVGSFLRPAEIRDARRKYAKGELPAAALTEIEDRHIARIIARQEGIGLRAATDGEFRRHAWQWDFLAGLAGVETAYGTGAISDRTATPRLYLKVTGKLGFAGHPMLEHFAFVKAHTRIVPKMCIPSPTQLVSVLRDWRGVVDRGIYPELAPLFADLAPAYRAAIHAFAAAGCTYLQIDDCNMSFLCDPKVQETVRARGDDPARMLRDFAGLLNAALRDRPPGMTILMHTCRGNTPGGFASGAYEAVAEIVFGGIDVDGFVLEFDDDRSGGFEPLRFLPKTKLAALGLVSTKNTALESRDMIARRLEAAEKFVDFDRLSLCPQCGFASSEETDRFSEDEQWAKLAHLVALADSLWKT